MDLKKIGLAFFSMVVFVVFYNSNALGKWTCSSDRYRDGKTCDCECGEPDPDCKYHSLTLKGCSSNFNWCDKHGHCCKLDCTNKECGDDGCGGSCGSCQQNHYCINGKCVCRPHCENKQCGPDSCGGSCGTCPSGTVCRWGLCCKPNCQGKECGNDGCGGSCGSCSTGYTCVQGKCIGGAPSNWHCSSTKYNSGNGCDCECGAYDPDCDKQPMPAYNCNPDEHCDKQGHCCKPNCQGKECGDDGCGGSCGNCTSNQVCDNGKCVQGSGDHDVIVADTGGDLVGNYDSSQDVTKTDLKGNDSGSDNSIKVSDSTNSSDIVFFDVSVDNGGHRCPDGMVYKYGSCYKEQPKKTSGVHESGGCSTSGLPEKGHFPWIMLFIFVVGLVFRKGFMVR